MGDPTLRRLFRPRGALNSPPYSFKPHIGQHLRRRQCRLAGFCGADLHGPAGGGSPGWVQAGQVVGEWLERERRLALKDPQAEPRPTAGRFTYLGHRVSRAGVAPTREGLRRMEERLRELVLRGDGERLERSLAAFRGVVGFGR